MRIVERIRRSQQEEASRKASRKASAEAEKIKWQQERRQKQQENAQRTNEILEESGVKVALIEIRDKMTGRLFGIGGGKLRQLDESRVRDFVKNISHIDVIGGIELVWDRRKNSHCPHVAVRGPCVTWKEMCIYVTPEGDLLLKRKMLGDYQRINRESWQGDKSMVEKELAEYFLNPSDYHHYSEIGGYCAGKIPGPTYVRDIDRR